MRDSVTAVSRIAILNMKNLITILFLLVFSCSVNAAVPTYQAFRGTGGIIVISNPPNGTIVIDGTGIGGATGAVTQVQLTGASNTIWAAKIDNLNGRGTNTSLFGFVTNNGTLRQVGAAEFRSSMLVTNGDIKLGSAGFNIVFGEINDAWFWTNNYASFLNGDVTLGNGAQIDITSGTHFDIETGGTLNVRSGGSQIFDSGSILELDNLLTNALLRVGVGGTVATQALSGLVMSSGVLSVDTSIFPTHTQLTTASNQPFTGTVGGAVTLNASGFNGNLATTDNTLQEVAQKFNDAVLGGSGSPAGNTTEVQFNTAGAFAANTNLSFEFGTVNPTLVIGKALYTAGQPYLELRHANGTNRVNYFGLTTLANTATIGASNGSHNVVVSKGPDGGTQLTFGSEGGSVRGAQGVYSGIVSAQTNLNAAVVTSTNGYIQLMLPLLQRGTNLVFDGGTLGVGGAAWSNNIAANAGGLTNIMGTNLTVGVWVDIYLTITPGVTVQFPQIPATSWLGGRFPIFATNGNTVHVRVINRGNAVTNAEVVQQELVLTFQGPGLFADTNFSTSTVTLFKSRSTNYADGNITINASTDVKARWTNAVAGNRSITFSTPVIGTSGQLSFVSDGSARTLPVLYTSSQLTWLSTNDTATATNILTAANKRGVLCWDVQMGTDGISTNFALWVKIQTP